MKEHIVELGPLAEVGQPDGLYGTWLRGHWPAEPVLRYGRGAGDELRAALENSDPAELAPLWSVAKFAALLPQKFRTLPFGPSAVVTGQQPGFLGGPLLTLFKISTAVSLARRRTAAGSPTVPVFWSGDDDDDLAEALGPRGWDPAGGALLTASPAPAAPRRQVLAERDSSRWAAQLLSHLQAVSNSDQMVTDLVALVADQVENKTPWGVSQTELLSRVFAGTDLVIIRGNDSDLHRAAESFYQDVASNLPKLTDLATERGRVLQNAGFHAQINQRSLSRPMFKVVDGIRQPAATADFAEVGVLRPGVMLRSPLQDFLLRPAAAVVGPGELAYLRQLDPLYDALGVPRSPLVPRLSGWLLPELAAHPELPETVLAPARQSSTASDEEAQALTDAITGPAQKGIAKLLRDELGVPIERADSMAAGRARRFAKGLMAMFNEEIKRRDAQRGPEAPQWVLPDGHRQERIFGLLSAVGLWGSELVEAVEAAAGKHLDAGLDQNWQQWAITVPERKASP